VTSILTWTGKAFVDVVLTVITGESRVTFARVRGQQVDALATILTGMHETLVDVKFTIFSSETGRTFT
jgi:hypothetical protein